MAGNYDTSCTSATTWYDWTGTTTATSGTYTKVVSTSGTCWASWVDYQKKTWPHYPVQLSPEEKKERYRKEQERLQVQAEQARLADIARREAEAVAKEAQERARKLFLEVLDTEQRQTFEKAQKFYLIGSDGERYEVDCTKHHQNVYQVDKEGKRKVGYCAYATGGVPLSDNHIVQKLLLETDAKAFLKVANSWRVAA